MPISNILASYQAIKFREWILAASPSRLPNFEKTRKMKLSPAKLFFFYKSIIYKNIEAEISEILRIF